MLLSVLFWFGLVTGRVHNRVEGIKSTISSDMHVSKKKKIWTLIRHGTKYWRS